MIQDFFLEEIDLKFFLIIVVVHECFYRTTLQSDSNLHALYRSQLISTALLVLCGVHEAPQYLAELLRRRPVLSLVSDYIAHRKTSEWMSELSDSHLSNSK